MPREIKSMRLEIHVAKKTKCQQVELKPLKLEFYIELKPVKLEFYIEIKPLKLKFYIKLEPQKLDMLLS